MVETILPDFLGVSSLTPVDWKNTSDPFINNIKDGLGGANYGVHCGLSEVNRLIHGVQKAKYYLVAADSGVGKTTFVDYLILKTWINAKKAGKKVHIFYGSFELSENMKKAKFCCFFIHLKYGKSIPMENILGYVPLRPLNTAEVAMVKEAYELVRIFLEDVRLIDYAVSPDTFYNSILSYYERKGSLTYQAQNAKQEKANAPKKVKSFIRKEREDIIEIAVVDHVGLMEGENTKQTIEECSRHAVHTRNKLGLTWFVIQQFSTDLLQSKRDAVTRLGSKASKSIAPSRLDLGESKLTYRDADVVIMLVKPLDFALESYDEIDCTSAKFGGVGEYLVILFIPKNRGGLPQKSVPLFVNYSANYVLEYPNELEEADVYTDKAATLYEEWKEYSPLVNE